MKVTNCRSGLAMVAAGLMFAGLAEANGGPFVIKYPGGDPAAKGVLARLGEDLRPGRESRLRVVKENLQISFEGEPYGWRDGGSPVVRVAAAYDIENPTGHEIEVDFGFPILRGMDSPVRVEVSNIECADRMTPSNGIFSPGLTKSISPI